jgi:hypothetical protein
MFSRMLEFFFVSSVGIFTLPVDFSRLQVGKVPFLLLKNNLGTQKILVWSYVPRILENIMAKFDTNYIIFQNVEIFKNYFFQIKKIL